MSEQQVDQLKTNKISGFKKSMAGLIVLTGSVIGTNAGCVDREIQQHEQEPIGIHQMQEESVNEYGVYLKDGTEFTPPDNTVIRGSLIDTKTGEILEGNKAIYVTGRRVHIDSILILKAKGDVYVSPQPNTEAVFKVAEKMADMIETTNYVTASKSEQEKANMEKTTNYVLGKPNTRKVEIKTLPGFAIPTAR